MERSAKAEDNLGLVRHIAQKFLSTGIEFDELISEGTVGLVKAANTYDESKGIKFATYACRCITNEILMFLRKAKKYQSDMPLTWINSEGDDFEITEVFAHLANYDNYCFEDYEERRDLRDAVARLGERDRQIIEMRYYQEKTQGEISEILGISQSYISRLEKRVLQKLRGELHEVY